MCARNDEMLMELYRQGVAHVCCIDTFPSCAGTLISSRLMNCVKNAGLIAGSILPASLF